MSFRTWVYVFALGLLTVGLLAASVVAVLDYKHGHANERDDAAQYQADTAQHGVNTCGAIMNESGVFGWLACLADDISADGSAKQSEYDLKAQQDMAAWAFGMLIATVWVAIITLFGVFFVWRTLTATQAMANETTRIGEAQTRGYLQFVAGQQVLRTERSSVNLHNGFDLEFRNTGTTPIHARFSDVESYLSHDDAVEGGPTFRPVEIEKEFGGNTNDRINFIANPSSKMSEISERFDGRTVKMTYGLSIQSTDIFEAVTKFDLTIACDIDFGAKDGDIKSHLKNIRVTKVKRKLQK